MNDPLCLVQFPVRQIVCYTDIIVFVITWNVNSGMNQNESSVIYRPKWLIFFIPTHKNWEELLVNVRVVKNAVQLHEIVVQSYIVIG